MRPASRYLVSHGGVADMCMLGEPTEARSCSATSGRSGSASRPRRLHPHRVQRGAARAELDPPPCARCSDAVLEWIPTWEDDPANAYRGAKAIVNVGAIEGGFGWRVSRTPHRADLFLDVRVPPDEADGGRAARGARDGARARRALPRLRRRGRGLRHGAGRGDRGGHGSSVRSTPRTRRCSATAPGRT